MLRGLTALVLTLLGMSAAWAQASVQAWPSKQPIRVVVPIAAGSGTDLTARLVFEQVSNQIGQAIVVENRVGAGGIIGTNAVAKAEPDGHTIFLTTAMLLAPALGTGIVLQHKDWPLWSFQLMALWCGVGGGNFASSMSNISTFFPKKLQGTALGLNAGLGNFGVTTMQIVIPLVMTVGLFGALGGEPMVLQKDSGWIFGKKV